MGENTNSLRMSKISKYAILFFSVIGLIFVYLFQRQIQNYFYSMEISRYAAFVSARTIRYLLNDFFMIWIIYGLFEKKKYVLFALYVQLFGFIAFLLPYFLIKYYVSHNGPLVSFLHRLIINPLLLILVIPALWYKEIKA